MVVVLVVAILMTRGLRQMIPRRGAEHVRDVLRDARATSGSGSPGRPASPYIPLFAAFFLLILFSNWSGLVPAVGRVE